MRKEELANDTLHLDVINVLRSFIWCTDSFCVFLTHASVCNLCLTYLDVGAFVNLCWQVNHHCPTAPTALCENWFTPSHLPLQAASPTFSPCFSPFVFGLLAGWQLMFDVHFHDLRHVVWGKIFLFTRRFSFTHPLSWKNKTYLLLINFNILAFMAVRNKIFAILCPISALCSNLSYIYSGFLFTFLLTFIRSFESLITFFEKKPTQYSFSCSCGFAEGYFHSNSTEMFLLSVWNGWFIAARQHSV